MARFLHHSLKIPGRNWRDFTLALSWILGLISGCTLCLSADTTAFSLMRMAPGCPVSIVRLLAVTFLPFLFSGFAAFVSQTWLLFPIVFFKSVTSRNAIFRWRTAKSPPYRILFHNGQTAKAHHPTTR